MVYQLGVNTTINLNSTMSADIIQAKIDRIAKKLNGNRLTFQFADGTYTLNHLLDFSGFTGGELFVQGNQTENKFSGHTNQAVILNFSAGRLEFQGVTQCEINNIRVIAPDVDFTILHFNGVTGFAVYGCYLECAGITTTAGIRANQSVGEIAAVRITKTLNGIIAQSSIILSEGNAGVTTNPVNGLVSNSGFICKNGAQPAGTTTNEVLNKGGLIRASVIQAITASDPPTQAELVSALGSASLYPSRNLLISSTSGVVYFVASNGTSWYYNAYTVGA